jgi:ribonuclease E
MELSRQRLQPSLEETAHINCPRCSGTGFIRGTESTALHVLRIMQEEAMKENTGAVHCQVPVDVASFLLNEKRSEIQKLEARLKVNIVMVPNPHLETPHYKVQRLRHDELNEMEHVPSSYEMVERPEEPKAPGTEDEAKLERQQPVVKAITPTQPAPMVAEAPVAPPVAAAPAAAPAPAPAATESGFLSRLLGLFKPPAPAATPAAQPAAATPAPQRGPRDGQRRDQRHDRGPRRDGRDGGRDGRRDGRGRDEHRDRQQQGRLEQRRNGQPHRDGQQRGEGQRGERRPDHRQQQPRHGGQPQQQQQRAQGQPQQQPQQQQRHPQRPPQPQQPPMEGEAPQFHQLAPEGQPQRPEREGEEHRRGRRRGGRGRDRGERGDRPREHQQVGDPAVIEAQRRIHELESRNEQPEATVAEAPRAEEPRRPEPERQPEPAHAEPPAFLVRQEKPREEAAPAYEAPKVDPRKLLDDAGLVMIETDRNRAPAAPYVPEEPVQLGRPRRERQRSTQQEEELQQVETKR